MRGAKTTIYRSWGYWCISVGLGLVFAVYLYAWLRYVKPMQEYDATWQCRNNVYNLYVLFKSHGWQIFSRPEILLGSNYPFVIWIFLFCLVPFFSLEFLSFNSNYIHLICAFFIGSGLFVFLDTKTQNNILKCVAFFVFPLTQILLKLGSLHAFCIILSVYVTLYLIGLLQNKTMPYRALFWLWLLVAVSSKHLGILLVITSLSVFFTLCYLKGYRATKLNIVFYLSPILLGILSYPLLNSIEYLNSTFAHGNLTSIIIATSLGCCLVGYFYKYRKGFSLQSEYNCSKIHPYSLIVIFLFLYDPVADVAVITVLLYLTYIFYKKSIISRKLNIPTVFLFSHIFFAVLIYVSGIVVNPHIFYFPILLNYVLWLKSGSSKKIAILTMVFFIYTNFQSDDWMNIQVGRMVQDCTRTNPFSWAHNKFNFVVEKIDDFTSDFNCQDIFLVTNLDHSSLSLLRCHKDGFIFQPYSDSIKNMETLKRLHKDPDSYVLNLLDKDKIPALLWLDKDVEHTKIDTVKLIEEIDKGNSFTNNDLLISTIGLKIYKSLKNMNMLDERYNCTHYSINEGMTICFQRNSAF
jgi:hypothetical protein